METVHSADASGLAAFIREQHSKLVRAHVDPSARIFGMCRLAVWKQIQTGVSDDLFCDPYRARREGAGAGQR